MAKRVFKSKKKLSTVRAIYRKWNEWDTGDILVGTFKGSQTDKYGKPNWLIEVVEPFFSNKKEQKRLAVGVIVGLNSSGSIDRALEKVEDGEMVQFTYNGMERMDGGTYKGKDKHLIEVDLVSEEGDEEEVDEDEVEDDDDL